MSDETGVDREALREAARAISALIDAAVRDFRKVYPEPHMLAANLALAVQAQNVIRALLAAAPAPTDEDLWCIQPEPGARNYPPGQDGPE